MAEMRMSPQALRLLAYLLEDPKRTVYGWELMRECDLQSGTLYPMLARLERLEWVQSEWADDESDGPRRRIYRLTPTGLSSARLTVAEWRQRLAKKSGHGVLRPRGLSA